MDNRYDWVAELRSELDKLDSNRPDYEQVAQLKKIEKLCTQKVKADVNGYILHEKIPYLLMIKNEIVEEIYDFIQKYIEEQKISFKGFQITKASFDGGRLMIRVHVDRSLHSAVNTHYLGQLVSTINFRKIISEMTGIGYANDYWATASMYGAFQKAKRNTPNWVLPYCTEIIRALDLIKQDKIKKKLKNKNKKA